MALDYDFWVGDLGFNLATSKDRPYERATAQFRKDQLDTAQRVADQSLTGWWTRGQLSFHKGAGLNYYEVLESETVYDRFKDCDGVAVFEPGQVTLAKALTSLSLDVTDVVPAPLSSGGGIYALTSTGVEYTAGTSTVAIDTSDSVVPTSITSSGTLYYVGNGTKIERQFVASVARTNHVTNPSFEADASGWSFTASGGHGSMNRSTLRSKYGTASLRIARGGWTDNYTATETLTGLSIGQVYVVSAWAYNESSSGSFYHSALKVDATTIGTATTADGWVRLSGTFTATATSHDLKLVNGPTVGSTGANPSLSNVHLDAVLFTESPYGSDYFDGSYPGASWVGTANASKSTTGMSTGTASVVRITNSGANWGEVWWAKGRLFAVDSDGYWYALADASATVSNVDAFWNTGRTDVNWSLADSPGAVYVSDGSSIYAVTVDTDGLVPTLAAPTTVAQVPLGETISSIGYYLGNLIVATSAGVRVAVIQNGNVYLGPLVIEGDFSSAGRMGMWDTLVYVVGRPTGRSGDYVLCAIDLSQSVTDLTYAWSPIATVSTVASTANGAVVDAAGVLYAWSGGDTFVASRDELTSDGYLTTAYVRFGTLEAKHFSSVLVRIGGTGGSIEVFRVDADGTETSLGSVAYDATSTELDLGMTSPAERVALKFGLSRDGSDSTKAPTLLGYQLKALPVPKRQRMIRVPLLLHSAERNRSGQAMIFDPWDRLAALEALEESNAVVTFSDRNTGESGSAYIEAVEVSSETPPAAGNDSVGGLIWLTLRKLA